MYIISLVEFLVYLVMFTVTLIAYPTFLFMVYKKHKTRQRIANTKPPYLYFEYKPKKLRKFAFCFLVVFLIPFLIFVFIAMIPMYKDLPSLINKNYSQVAGEVTDLSVNKSVVTVYIKGIDVKQLEWISSKKSIKKHKKYKIYYLKHSKYIIRYEQIK